MSARPRRRTPPDREEEREAGVPEAALSLGLYRAPNGKLASAYCSVDGVVVPSMRKRMAGAKVLYHAIYTGVTGEARAKPFMSQVEGRCRHLQAGGEAWAPRRPRFQGGLQRAA
jgi:hypothetical protein